MITLKKAEVKRLEDKLTELDGELETLQRTLRGHKLTIEGYERRVRLGQEVNSVLYQAAIDSHNRAVRGYNATLTRRNLKFSEYKSAIDSVNEMVRRYNRGR